MNVGGCVYHVNRHLDILHYQEENNTIL